MFGWIESVGADDDRAALASLVHSAAQPRPQSGSGGSGKRSISSRTRYLSSPDIYTDSEELSSGAKAFVNDPSELVNLPGWQDYTQNKVTKRKKSLKKQGLLVDEVEDDGKPEPNGWHQRAGKYAKILTPHAVLILMLLIYLVVCAEILIWMERKADKMINVDEVREIEKMFKQLAKDSWKVINGDENSSAPLTEEEWSTHFKEYLTQTAERFDYRRNTIRKELQKPEDVNNAETLWTYATALLYVLTVLTTCGYEHVKVNTNWGKIFCCAYALVGIPLMFITAADIGKFLSESLITLTTRWAIFNERAKALFRRSSRKGGRPRIKEANVRSRLEIRRTTVIGQTESKLWFPIGAYVGCICLYCAVGAVMFMHYLPEWSFIHAFHFGFNVIVMCGLGMLVVDDYIFLSLIVAFVIIGLSVVTMCVDLASSHLKVYFARIHYFGRAKKFLGIKEELMELLSVLAAVRKKKEPTKVTWSDIQRLLHRELGPYTPFDMSQLRYIDETSAMSLKRQQSFSSIDAASTNSGDMTDLPMSGASNVSNTGLLISGRTQ